MGYSPLWLLTTFFKDAEWQKRMVTKTREGCVVNEKANSHHNNCGMPMLRGLRGNECGFWARLVVNREADGREIMFMVGGWEVTISRRKRKGRD